MTATTEHVILVDENDQQIGVAEKLVAHEKNLLHRAFSVFIFRNQLNVELLLQQRALTKYHSPGLWTNSCCSHPRSGEETAAAGERRLFEELGVKAKLTDIGWFIYNAHFTNGLHEHEADHVLVGTVDGDIEIKMNPEEVESYRWVTLAELDEEMRRDPGKFTFWFQEALEMARKTL